MSDLSTSDLTSSIELNNKKMSDITDLLDLNDKQTNDELISTTIVDCLRTHSLQNDLDNYERCQWDAEENYLKSGRIKLMFILFI
jgi:hypothetical protein